jgi:hypothetical protein
MKDVSTPENMILLPLLRMHMKKGVPAPPQRSAEIGKK